MNEKLAAPKPEEATTNKEVIAPWTGGGTQTALPGNFMAEPLPAPPTPWAPIVQQIHSHKPILACEKCGAESERQAKGLCFGEECPMTLRTGWIESLIQINIDTIAAGFYGDPALVESLSAQCPTCKSSNKAERKILPHPTEDAWCFDDWHGAVSPEPTKERRIKAAHWVAQFIYDRAKVQIHTPQEMAELILEAEESMPDELNAVAVSQSTAEEEGK